MGTRFSLQRHSFKILTCIFILTSFTGCSVFHEYIHPATKTPDNWQATLPHAGQVDSLVNWWAQFNDPVLTQLLDAAEKDNPSLEIAIANIKSARAAIVTARAAGLPSVTANASESRARSNVFGGAATTTVGITDSSSATLDASWEVDLFGAIKFSKQAAQARFEAKQSDWHEARVSLAAEVTNNYLDYRTCQLLINSYGQQKISTGETARLTNIKVKAGFAAPADAALAEAAANSTISSLIAQQAECDNTIKSLVALTGMDEPALRTILTKNIARIPVPAEFTVTSLPANVIKQRPDLISDERALAAASADIGTAEANRYPSLSLTGSIGYAETSIGNFSSNGRTWSFGPSLSLPVFNGGKLKAQVTSAEAKYELALATYEQSVRTAIKEVEQSLVNLDSAAKREQAEQLSSDQYRAYLKATEINWRAGGASLLNLEEARRQAITAEVNLINQQHNRVQSWIALYKALGGGWPANNNQMSTGKTP